MRHVVLEEWSRRASFLHRRDARVKTAAALALLVAIAFASPLACAATGVLLLAIALLSGLPVTGMLGRAAVILPFSGTFALITLIGGRPDRALLLVSRGYLSALAAVLLIATTPLPALLRGLGSLGVPPVLVTVIQFLYRYLFVLFEQAFRMRQAFVCRNAGKSRLGFEAAAGALAVLFGRSYTRAEGIQRAMLARGFDGTLRLLDPQRLAAADLAVVAGAAALIALTRVAG